MATLGFVQVAPDSSGKSLRTTIVEDASTVHQEVMNLAGSTGDLWEPRLNAIPSSSAVTMPVSVVTSASSVLLGSVQVPNTVNVSLISPVPLDVQQNAGTPWGVTHSSSLTWNVQLSTAVNGAYIDPRIIMAAGSSINVGVVPAGSSSYALGVVWQGSTYAVSLISAGSSINVGVVPAGSSSYPFGQVWAGSTWPTAIVSGGSSVSFSILGTASSGVLGTVLSATGLTGAAIDPRQVTIIAATSGATITTIGAGSSGVTGTTLISTALAGAAIDPRIIAAQATSVVLGTVAVQQSTSYRVQTRNFDDSTSNYNQKHFYTTGVLVGTVSTMLAFQQVTNLTSGTSGFSFNVAAGKIFRIEYVNCSLRVTSGSAGMWADFAIRADASTAGATGTDTPVWQQRIIGAPPTSAAIGGGEEISVTGLTIDLPSSASFGVTIIAASSASNDVAMNYGGIEFTI